MLLAQWKDVAYVCADTQNIRTRWIAQRRNSGYDGVRICAIPGSGDGGFINSDALVVLVAGPPEVVRKAKWLHPCTALSPFASLHP